MNPSARVALFGLIVVATALGGCQRNLTTGSISRTAVPPPAVAQGGSAAPSQEQLTYAARLQKDFKRNPDNPDVALAFAESLREIGRESDVAGVLEMASAKAPGNPALLSAYGRQVLRDGRPGDALAILKEAEAAGARDARVYSAQGAALDQLGRSGEARKRYEHALTLDPNNSTVLANLGLSYALSDDIDKAEATLRRAASDPAAHPKVRQNLALVLAMQGKFREAETVASRDLSPDDVAVNMAYLKKMMSSPNRWDQLKGIDGATG